MDKIAVLIPCWNEAVTIEKVVTDYRRVLPEAVVYVYDNNSTDGTAALAAPLDAENADVVLPPALLQVVREKGIRPGSGRKEDPAYPWQHKLLHHLR